MAKDLAAAVEAPDIVVGLGRYIPKAAIAHGAGVSPRTVHTWATKHVPVRPANYAKLTAVRDVVLVLRDSLTKTGVRQWMLAPNRNLDLQTPIQVLREGHPDKVLLAAKAFAEGVYL